MTEVAFRGHPAAPGAALGPAWTRVDGDDPAPGDADQEWARVERGLALVVVELDTLAARLRSEGHDADADIVEANRMMADDPALVIAARAAIAGGETARRAIAEAAAPHIAALANLDDPTLASRAADLRAIARRAGELANGDGVAPPAGSIVLAEDLGPSEVASWAGQIAGIVLAQSGTTAHAAIVARSLGIPLVTGVGATALEIPDGEQIAVDADRGLVLRNFSPATRVRFRGRIERLRREAERALDERHEPAVTRDGRAVRLLANAGTRAEVDAALAAGADGIGLLRTELAFLDATGWPDEESHRRALAPLLAPLAHRIATIRTLDFGGDKTPPFLVDTDAASPLGRRGIRLALASPHGVAPQLRALLAVAGDAVVRILIPMISEADEVDAVREIARAARDDIVPGGPDPLVGAMIEIPAAALNASAIARRCDFLSVGTNDLIQYTLATDRQDAAAAARAVAYHPAVLRLIARAVTAAHSAGIPVDVCGEAAGDAETLPLLVGLGVDELSVSPARLAPTRRMIRALTLSLARAAAADALSATNSEDVARIARAALDLPGSGERGE
ncbi:MAG: PEP-utilizing enzyme [Actinomycetota bacterium]|nr:PEP-utilizing enzyme [Actinomycetota bacterium]